MSDATRKAMIEAIGAHVADTMEGAYLMDWAFVGYVPRFGVEAAEANNYYIDASSQADHIIRGLLAIGISSLEGQGDPVDD